MSILHLNNNLFIISYQHIQHLIFYWKIQMFRIESMKTQQKSFLEK